MNQGRFLVIAVMASGAPGRMGAMTNSSKAWRDEVATWISRHVHTDDFKALSEFFFNLEMEDDLVLNLATDNAVPGSSRAVHVKKGGKWTDR